MSRIRTSFRKPGKSPKLVAALAATAVASATAVAGPLAVPPGAPRRRPSLYSTQRGPGPGRTPLATSGGRATIAASRCVTLTAAAVTQRQAALRRAQKMLGHFGWGHRQWNPLYKLWNRESSWNKYARNPYSGAYGIPQAVPGSKMASAGRNWRTNATTQIRWGMRYIKSVYGYPRRAWNHELAYGWY